MIEMTGYIFDENDDLASVMDAILRRVKSARRDNADCEDDWIDSVNHRDTEDALSCMMPKERELIKKFFYQEKNILDISIEMNMELDLVGGYIRSAKDQIAIWM